MIFIKKSVIFSNPDKVQTLIYNISMELYQKQMTFRKGRYTEVHQKQLIHRKSVRDRDSEKTRETVGASVSN